MIVYTCAETKTQARQLRGECAYLYGRGFEPFSAGLLPFGLSARHHVPPLNDFYTTVHVTTASLSLPHIKMHLMHPPMRHHIPHGDPCSPWFRTADLGHRATHLHQASFLPIYGARKINHFCLIVKLSVGFCSLNLRLNSV